MKTYFKNTVEIAVILLMGASARGDLPVNIPNTMNFSGTLLTPEGQPRDGTFTIFFRVFDDPGTGNRLHEQRIDNVAVRAGEFSVVLGPFGDAAFRQGDTANRWLEVQVNGETPILPRQHLVSVPYAQRTASVDGAQSGAITGRLTVRSDGVSSGGVWFTRVSTPTTNTSFIGRGVDAQNFVGVYTDAWRLTVGDTGNVDIPTGDLYLYGRLALRGNDGWLRLNQDGAFPNGVHTPGALLPGSLNVGCAFNCANPGGGNVVVGGNVGVGTLTPQARLDVEGDIRVAGNIRANGPDVYAMPAGCGSGVVVSLSSTCQTPYGMCRYYHCDGETCGMELGYVSCDWTQCYPTSSQCNGTRIGRLLVSP
jgi:hypothetical protein